MIQIPLLRAARGLSALLLGATFAGCANNATKQTASTQTSPPTSTTATGAATTTKAADNHDAEIRAAIGPFFPGAQLVARPFPFNDTAAAHLSEEEGVKFSGKEGHWQVFDAVKNGQRVGLGVMTHSALPDGKDMHIAFGVNPEFAVVGVAPLDAPDNTSMRAFTAQLKGKTHKSAFIVGGGLKTGPGLEAPIAQISADAVHKGLAILEENFNPQHDADETAGATQSGTVQPQDTHEEGDGHKH